MIFAVVLGIGYGSRISAVPGVLIEYFGLQNVGTLLGVFFTASGALGLARTVSLPASQSISLPAIAGAWYSLRSRQGFSALSRSLRFVATVSPSAAQAAGAM